MHLPGCTVPPLVDWLSSTVAFSSSFYGHPEPGAGPPPWSELAINHHCPSVRPAVTMRVPLYTACSAEQWEIQKGRKGQILLCTAARWRSVLSHCSFDAPPLLTNPNLYVSGSRGTSSLSQAVLGVLFPLWYLGSLALDEYPSGWLYFQHVYFSFQLVPF